MADYTYANLFALGLLVIGTTGGWFIILCWMWKGVRGDLKRWKEMTEEEQDNFFRLTCFKVVAAVLILEVSGMGVFAFFKLCQEVLLS